MRENPESLDVSLSVSSAASHVSKTSFCSDSTVASRADRSLAKTFKSWLDNKRHGPAYYGKPLEDRYNNEYFLVVSSRFGKTQVHRFNKAKSLYLFGYESKLRRLCLRLITNQYFEMFVLLTILTNCVFLAMTNPPEEPEYVFAVIYTVEMFFKIIAKGFVFHKYAYLRDPWNWLDFIVVIMGYITFSPGVANLSGIRTFRVFRALRTISAVKGLKAMVNTLLMSMKMLWDVMVLTLFFICIFALIGMQLFVGVLRNKCVEPVPVNLTVPYRTYASNSSLWKLEDEEILPCGNTSGSRSCPGNFSCLTDAGPNPNYGYTNFDHFGWALLTSFQIVTLDYWENVYNDIIYAMGPWYVVYFAVVIFFGPFYLVNLVLAVVAASYEAEVQASKMETEEERKEQRRVASTYSIRRSSIMSIMYGQNETPLDASLQKTMYDIPMVTCSQATMTKSVDDVASVLQIKEMDSVSQSHRKSHTPRTPQITLAPHTPRASFTPRASHTPRAPHTSITSMSEKSFVIKPVEAKKPSKAHRLFERFRRSVKKFACSKYFELFIVFCILLNTLFMAIEYHGMDAVLKYTVTVANLVFTFIFLMEMVLKLLGLGVLGYVQSRWNIFDGFVVVISVVDFIVVQTVGSQGTGTSILRTFRLLRILKLAKSWSTMSSLLSTIGKSLGALGNLTIILGIIIYIFAVVGMQLFGSSYTVQTFGGPIPRWNFTDFFHSFLVIFRVLCGEWIESLWDCMRATGPAALLLYIPAFIIGNFIILNLFLALLLSSFASESSEKKREREKKASVVERMREALLKMRKQRVVPEITGEDNPNSDAENADLPGEPGPADGREDIQTADEVSEASIVCCCVINTGDYDVPQCLPKSLMPSVTCGHNSGACAVWILVRHKIKILVEHKYFEWFIVVLIATSSIALAFEDVHIDDKPTLKAILSDLNIFFAVVFSLEMLLKFIGLGFSTYFTNPWNWLDFIIVVVSLVTIFGDESVSFMRSLRTLRALRPLRAVSRFEGMRVVITSLLHAFPGIANVFLVSMVFWLIFSIMGVQSFGGKFYKCLDASGEKLPADVVPNKTVCLAKGYRWINSNINFDNSVNGFLALLQVATFEGWMEIMEDAVDSRDIDEQPIRESNFPAYLYFVVFIILGTFFTLNLIIGVIIDNFNQLKQQMEAVGSMDIFLTANQRNWMNALKSAASKKPKKKIKRPQNIIQSHLYDLVQTRKFEVFIMTVITLNMVTMMLQHYDQSPQVTLTLEMFNFVFTGIFIVEAMMRIMAMRKWYFANPWNVFDFVIVICSIIGIVLENLQQSLPISPSLLRVVRVFRVGRLLRFFESAKGIRRLLFSLMISLPALANIGALLFLVIFIYAIIGMSLFGNVKKTGALNHVVNFESFGNSFILLFRVMTSAGWNDILEPLMIQPPDCDPAYRGLPDGNCGAKLNAIIFLVTFIVTIFLILINMYIAIILENYNQVMEQEKIGITNEDIDLFYQQWEQYDPNATQYIDYKDLSDFVHRLEGSLRIPKPNKAACALLNVPLVNGDMIHCLDLMQGLVKRIVCRFEEEDSEGFQLVMSRMEERFKTAFPSRNQHVSTNTTMKINQQIAAASVIIRAVRRYKERKLLETLQAHVLEETHRVRQSGSTDGDDERSLSGSDVSVASSEDNEVAATTPNDEPLNQIENTENDCDSLGRQSAASAPCKGMGTSPVPLPLMTADKKHSIIAWGEEPSESRANNAATDSSNEQDKTAKNQNLSIHDIDQE